jgi:hypothetical protein
VDYESGRPDGGLVCALDLQTIQHGFEEMFPNPDLKNKVDHFILNYHVYHFVH